MSQHWSMIYPTFITLDIAYVPSIPIQENILVSVLVHNHPSPLNAGVQSCFTSYRPGQEFLLMAGRLEDWVTRCSKAVVRHNDLVRSEGDYDWQAKEGRKWDSAWEEGLGWVWKKQKVKARKGVKWKRKQRETKRIKNKGEGSSGGMSRK